MHRHVRTWLTTLTGAAGMGFWILYGGSVTADDAGEGLGLPDVGGVLIGGTSLLAGYSRSTQAGAGGVLRA